MALNIFRLIGDFFELLFIPFEWIRLTLAKADAGWWTSNAVNWVFVLILIVLLTYWVLQSLKFKRNGTEDRV